ncbi:unnamed protein product [Enterobius vermicularis]|uniref:AcidPPc domain-containing protein n=1 Tax=Enterobius vermicularis TaxID=51028 RepID=A0A0N4VKM6_ENTVE|nr:unnamed protein product [Enterobius vermicularis]
MVGNIEEKNGFYCIPPAKFGIIEAYMLSYLSFAYFPMPTFLIFPIVVGISRVILGHHYISDVIAGYFLGWIESYVVVTFPYSWIISQIRAFF